MGSRDRERDRPRGTDAHRQTGTDSERRHRGGQTHRGTDDTEGQTTQRQMTETDRHTQRQTHRGTDTETDTQRDR